MPAFRTMLVLALVCLGSPAFAQKQWHEASEDTAARVLGPRWRQLSRDSGMIFSGTVLAIHTSRLGDAEAIPIVEVTFRVEHAIAGVRQNQTLTIREWAGAWSEHPLRNGQRVLLLLYPRSRLGLTSPVGGSLGQVALSAKNTVVTPVFVPDGNSSSQLRESESRVPISLNQLQRAIRSARSSTAVRASRERMIAKEE